MFFLTTKNTSIQSQALFQGFNKQMVCTCEGLCMQRSFLAFLVHRAQLPPCTCSMLFHLSYSHVTPGYSQATPHSQSPSRALWTAPSVFTGLFQRRRRLPSCFCSLLQAERSVMRPCLSPPWVIIYFPPVCLSTGSTHTSFPLTCVCLFPVSPAGSRQEEGAGGDQGLHHPVPG